MAQNTANETPTVAADVAAHNVVESSIHHSGAEITFISGSDDAFAIKSEWMGAVVEEARKQGYIVDTINAAGDNAEVLFKQSEEFQD